MSDTQAADAQGIVETYRMLAEGTDRPVPLLAITDMYDWTVERYHAALNHLIANAPAGTCALLEPEPKLRSLTELDHMVAIKLGGGWKHTLSIIEY